ncbi:MAG: Rrf2 family transcriptional regulator [Candidatus Bipolaricaulaceae bacterium]
MAELIRFSEGVALAFHALARLAQAEGRLSAAGIAAQLGASPAHVAKVLQVLVRAKLVTAKRGPHGGYALARPPEEIRLLEVYEAVEGELRRDGCVFSHPVCAGQGCLFGDLVEGIRARLRAELSGRTLAEAVGRPPRGDECPFG